jgi:hypothetical protein
MRIARIVLISLLVVGALTLAGCKGSTKTTDAGAAATVAPGSGYTTVTPVSGLVDGLAGRWKMKYTVLSATGPDRKAAKVTPTGWHCMVSNDDLSILMGTAKYKGKVKQVGASTSKKWHYKGTSTYLGAQAEEYTTVIEVDAELLKDMTVIEGVQKTTVTSNLRGRLLTAKYKIRAVRTSVLP